MEFLSSPVHGCTYDVFDDSFFEIRKEMDFNMHDEFNDTISLALDNENDLNDCLYGVWNTKHPSSSTVSSSSSSYLDVLGGDPESAIMVNPNIVIPNRSNFEEEKRRLVDAIKQADDEMPMEVNDYLNLEEIDEPQSIDNEDVSTPTKKVRSKFNPSKENVATKEYAIVSQPKNGVRILKPAVIETVTTKIKSKNPGLKNGHYNRDDSFYPKPAFSYSCLIAMALKNSKHGCLPVSEIYNFMCNHFPYFKTAPNGWKNSVRHNLSLNKCFEKIEKPAGSTQRKGCLWALNPTRGAKLEEEVSKCAKKDTVAIKKAMEYPEHLELLERGDLKCAFDMNEGIEDDEDDVDTMDEDDSEIPDSLKNEDDATDAITSNKPKEPFEFKIEVDESMYNELVGSVKNEPLYAIDDSNDKKPRRYYIQVRASSPSKIEPEIDQYDINNYLQSENNVKMATVRKTPPRFTKRLSPNSKIKQIRFKSWD